MKFSIIVPSYNQPDYIEDTFKNLVELKKELYKVNVDLEILLFDNCSAEEVQDIIIKYSKLFDYIEIANDKGQYDAINKGILRLTGDYWTWLNTDDLININGFLKIIKLLRKKPDIDYIYGNIEVIDENGIPIREYIINKLTLNSLRNISCSVHQPGSFFRTGFTKTIGLLRSYDCCFDYDYILRLFNTKSVTYRLNEVVSHFRYYSTSKSGALESKFVKEQLLISKYYDRKFISYLTYQLYKRKFKVLLKNTIFKHPNK